MAWRTPATKQTWLPSLQRTYARTRCIATAPTDADESFISVVCAAPYPSIRRDVISVVPTQGQRTLRLPHFDVTNECGLANQCDTTTTTTHTNARMPQLPTRPRSGPSACAAVVDVATRHASVRQPSSARAGIGEQGVHCQTGGWEQGSGTLGRWCCGSQWSDVGARVRVWCGVASVCE